VLQGRDFAGVGVSDGAESYLFRDTIIKLIASPNLEYQNLTAKIQGAA
jgi:hypothetical protein